jgi:feruloyl esterase
MHGVLLFVVYKGSEDMGTRIVAVLRFAAVVSLLSGVASYLAWGQGAVTTRNGEAQDSVGGSSAIVTPEAGACTRLAKLKLPNATITKAEQVAPGSQPLAGGLPIPPPPPLPAFCRVAATLAPSADSDIKMEVWLPQDWNGKFQMIGNSGWGGEIPYSPMVRALVGGYATAGSDTGHMGDGNDASFALGHPEKLVDFGWRAVHETTIKAKALVGAYYGKAARYSYFWGCCMGGRQGLKEAQRFPSDYDGIIAHSPCNDAWRFMAYLLWVARATLPAGSPSYIPPAKGVLIFKAVRAACDAIDGVKDGAIEDPRQCHFEPKQLLCKKGDGPDCLTASQVAAAEKIYSGPLDPRTGKSLYPGVARGSELSWEEETPGLRPNPATISAYKYIILKNPNWDYRTFDFEKDLKLARKVDGGNIEVTDPDLDAFRAHLGKLIQIHGWGDIHPPQESIDFYESVISRQSGGDRATKLAQTQGFYRLFMVPGMFLCFPGGTCADYFDMQPVLENWVEKGAAPDKVIASKFKAGNWVDAALEGKTGGLPGSTQPGYTKPGYNPTTFVVVSAAGVGAPQATRPLCPYPAIAKWTGKGNTNEATSFACVAGPEPNRN